MTILRSLQLEWLKMKNYKIFWILLGMYLTALLVIATGGRLLLEWLKTKGLDFDGIDPTIIPVYDFPDIWQNITWLGAFLKLFPAFIVVISVNNDLIFNTLRQNIIDGLSKREYMLSKLGLIAAITLISTLLLFLAGLFTGFIYSSVVSAGAVFQDTEFLLAFFVEVAVYCTLAFLLALHIKKSGFVIVLLFLYTLMFEPILAGILSYSPTIRESTEWIVDYLPVYSLYNLIDVPFKRYYFQEIRDYIEPKNMVIVLAWFTLYIYLTRRFLMKKDLN